jgi:hypothetical protein
MSRSRSRLAADWFAKLRVNAGTQAVEHEDVEVVDAATTTALAAKADTTYVNTAIGNINIPPSNNASALTTGTLPADRIGSGAITDAKIAGMSSSKLSGDLPAISGANLTGLAASFADLTGTTVSASDPTISSNPSAVGHLWINSTSGEQFVATDITAGVNIWKNTSGGEDITPSTQLVIAYNVNNYDIGAAVISAGADKATNVILTINAGVIVSSTSSSNPAMKTGTGWALGTTITINNYGTILGASGVNTSAAASGGYGANGGSGVGGSGGAGGNGTGSADSVNNGGNTFEHSQTGDTNLSVVFGLTGVRTAGASATKTISGGGGGGGAGGAGWYNSKGIGGSGGGGGAGTPGGSGGAHGVLHVNVGYDGAAGTSTTGGLGGASYAHWSSISGAGGDGGDLGMAGGSGGPHSPNGTSGGSGGSAGTTGYISGASGTILVGNTSQIS